jgi:SagB-type dehydrogenase family enzyme
MSNSDIEQTWAYHDATKHSGRSIRANMHRLDFANQPLPFKIYESLDPIRLPQQIEQTGIAAIASISEQVPTGGNERIPALRDLARILYYSAGITKRRSYPGGEIYFRAAACTGALYEFELYLVCGNLPDLEAGIYHFGPVDFSLRRLRAGDFRSVLAHATALEDSVVHAPVHIVCTGTYWRNSWKYQARTYRHFGWDNGTLLANILAVCNASLFPARVICGFIDSEVNALLDVDSEHEAAFSMVSIGFTNETVPAATAVIHRLNLPVAPLSRNEIEYPQLQIMHQASSLESPEEVMRWRARAPGRNLPPPQFQMVRLEPLNEGELSRDVIEQVILRRGSTRKFSRRSISFSQLSTLLETATKGISADFLDPFGTQLNDLYLIVNAVEGLNSGAYVFHRDQQALECLKEGQFRGDAQYLGLQQELPGDASVAVFFLADLNAILSRLGNRGYRAVQLEAGILGGKLYLGAYALRLGATGLTFFDDDVTNFFSPHATGKSAIFLVAIGRGLNWRSSIDLSFSPQSRKGT